MDSATVTRPPAGRERTVVAGGHLTLGQHAQVGAGSAASANRFTQCCSSIQS